MGNTARLEEIATALPGSERVDVWGGDLMFRVRERNFLTCDGEGTRVTLKLPVDEAEALAASDAAVEPAFGLEKHGWIVITLGPDEDDELWRRLAEWVRTSYVLVAPGDLAEQVSPGAGGG